MTPRSGISGENRILLERLHQNVQGPFRASDAATILGLSVPRARRLLAHLGQQGWLTRVRRGYYLVVPLGANVPRDWREDPWIVAATLFAPCYIGGWSACEHWDLTDQIFREIVVMTTKPIRASAQTVQSTPFKLKRLSPDELFGTRTVWKGSVKVQVSDPSRTIADLLADPSVGGGIRHVSAAVLAYFSSEHRDDALLATYIDRLGNKSGYKRLGYLLETLEVDAPELIETCATAQSRGVTQLDPDGPPGGQILSRWNLRINVAISQDGQS